MILRSLLTIQLILIALVPQLSLAQDGNDQEERQWYQIELLIYANNDPAARDNEQWQQHPRLHYPSNSRQLIATDSPTPTLPTVLQQQAQLSPTVNPPHQRAPQAFKLLPRQQRELANAARRINRQADFRPLFHGVWRQQLESRDRAQSLVINGGDRFGSHFELEGTVTVAVDRYLHVETDLWLSIFSNSGGLKTFPRHRLPPRPPSIDGQSDEAATVDARLDQHYTIEDIAVMRQKRRMRSGELHYIDHPSMALLVQITPYEPPEPAADSEDSSTRQHTLSQQAQE